MSETPAWRSPGLARRFACAVYELLILTALVLIAGFPFLASIIAIFSGAQLFALGIIGEYLARMHFRSMDKPPYTVRSNGEGRGGQ